jgi:hypothetical protein
MTTPVKFVQNATYVFTPETSRVPRSLWTVFVVFNKIHATWRWYRRYNLYTQQQSMAQLFAGHVVDNIISETHFLRIAAQSLLIATRILECVKAQEDFCNNYGAWKRGLTGNYTISRPVRWRTEPVGPFSASTVSQMEHFGARAKERVVRVASTTSQLAKSMFFLSMKVMDTLDAINWTPEARRDAVVESFVNIGIWLDTAVNNKETLLDGLERNKRLIEHILTMTPVSYSQLHSGVSSALRNTERVHNVYQRVIPRQVGAVVGRVFSDTKDLFFRGQT